MPMRMSARLACAATAVVALVAATDSRSDPREKLIDIAVPIVTVTQEQIQQTGLAIDVLKEINKARVDPKGYADGLRRDPVRIRGIGSSDMNEALAFLDGQRPLSPLTGSPSLTDIANIHIRDIGPLGLTSHVGSDGTTLGGRWRNRGIFTTTLAEELSYGQTTPRAVVVQFIVDPGQPGRPHRLDLFNPIFTQAGAACGPHKKFKSACVVNLASPYMRNPPMTSAPPATPPQWTCPTGLQPFEIDGWRQRAFDIMLGAAAPVLEGDKIVPREFARANETAYQAFKSPSSLSLGIDAGSLWKLPKLDYGFCAPPLPEYPPPPPP